MAQIPFRCNLSAATFPLVSSFMGRTVVVPQYDQNYIKRAKLSGEDSDMDIGIPQVYYGHNIVPSGQGFKSVGYTSVFPAVDGISTFDKIIPIRDADMTSGWLAVCSDGKVYIAKAGDVAWTDVTASVPGWPGGQVTYGVGSGVTYVCFSRYDVYKVNVDTRTIAPVALTGLTTSDIVAIWDAANYLCVTDGIDVYWSSTIDPEDFVPSIATGAGSGTPNDVQGLILAGIPVSNGYALYTLRNIVLASYSGNARFPWIFKPASGSRGVSDIRKVSFDGDSGINYAWTSGGLLKVTAQGCSQVSPETSDFLAGKVFEDFNTTTNTFQQQYLTSMLRVRLAYIGARYLVASYGISSYTHALVYDSAFKRWGKLKVTHTDCFEVSLNTDTGTITSDAASPKKTLGFLTNTGAVSVANFDFGDITADAVLILGKYQFSRTRLTTLNEIDVEVVDEANSNFSVVVLTTLDGKTIVTPTVTPTTAIESTFNRKYVSRVTGMNHSIVFKGAFNLLSVMLQIVNNGRR